MKQTTLPRPLYVQVRDHLEQAIAVLSHDPAAVPLRALLDEAVDISIELAHLSPAGATILHLRSSNEVRNKLDGE
ncbi:hypothetical protein [Devosia sp. A449]